MTGIFSVVSMYKAMSQLFVVTIYMVAVWQPGIRIYNILKSSPLNWLHIIIISLNWLHIVYATNLNKILGIAGY